FALGAHGAITALTAAVPGACVKLWNAVQAKDHAKGLDLHRRLNTLWNALNHDNLPACVKYIQHRQGLAMHLPRAPMEPVTQAQKAVIDKALDGLIYPARRRWRDASSSVVVAVSEVARDRIGRLHHLAGENRNSIFADPLRGSRDTDGGKDLAVSIADGGRYTVDPDLMFALVD